MGDSSFKDNGDFRVVGLNVGILSHDVNKGYKTYNLIDTINKLKCDIMCISEHGMDMSKINREHLLSERIGGQWEQVRHRFSWNVHSKSGSKFLYGGTGIIATGPITTKIKATGSDPTGLGRWTWMLFRENMDRTLRVVSIYCPAGCRGGPTSVVEQHRNYFLAKGINCNPKDRFYSDLADEIIKWNQEGNHIMIVGDFNEKVTSPRICDIMQNDNVHFHEALYRLYAETAPGTHASNRNNLTIDGIWASNSIKANRGGYTEFGLWDHRATWTDWNINSVFGHDLKKIPPKNCRRLQCSMPVVQRNYITKYKQLCESSNLLNKIKNAQSQIYLRMFDNEDGPPNGQIEFSSVQFIERYESCADLFEELEKLDQSRTEFMKSAENKCRKLYKGDVPFSPELNKHRTAINYYRLATRKKLGRKVSTRMLQRLEKKAGINANEWRNLSLQELATQRAEAEKGYRKIKPNAIEHRKAFINKMVEEEIALNGGKRESLFKSRLTREETRRQSACIKLALGKNQSNSVNMIVQNLPDGTIEELHDEQSVINACLQGSKKKYTSVYSTELCRGQFGNLLGSMGLSPFGDRLAKGEDLLLNNVSLETKKFLSALKSSQAIPLNSVGVNISSESHRYILQKVNERTSSSPSGLHYGMWKSNAKEDILTEIDTRMREIPFITGYHFKRWLNMLDILLLKEQNNFTFRKIRTIGLMEADYQLNNKLLGKLTMDRTMENQSLFEVNAPEQYGAKAHHRVQEVSLNEHIIYDILRQTHRPAGLVSLDAETCFDRMSHPAISLCFRRSGIPIPTIFSTLSTIQKATHYVRTAFGDSTIGYKGSTGQPLQGFPQGHGTGPCGFNILSTPIINSLRNEDIGFFNKSPISKEEVHIVGFVFFDDSKILHTSKSYLNPHDIAPELQRAIKQWESSLSVSGGALVPSKSNWHPIAFETKGNNKWRYLEPNKIQGNVQIKDSNGMHNIIQKLSVTESQRELGLKLRKDGSEQHNVSFFREKTVKWAELMRTNKMRREDVWQALQKTIWKGIEFPLMATCFTKAQCRYIMAPALKIGLQHSGVQSNFPRKLVHGPLGYQGLGIPDIHVLQTIEHVQALLRHGREESPSLPTGKLIRTSAENIIMSLGSGESFWNLNPDTWGHLTPNSWLKSTWKDCFNLGIRILDDIDRPTTYRENDVFIMDKAVKLDLTPEQLQLFNWCRCYCNAITLADISNAKGDKISSSSWNCEVNPYSLRKLLWPPMRRPSVKAVSIWRTSLTKLFLIRENDRKMHTRLGKFNKSHPHQWFLQQDEDRLYIRNETSNDMWETWSRYPTVHSRKYTRTALCTPLPPNVVAVSGSINGDSSKISIDSISDAQWEHEDIPEPDLTLHDQIQKLPEDRKWQIQRYKLNGDLDILLNWLQEGSLIGVCDGSFKEGVGASAFFIGSLEINPNYLTGVNRTPGRPIELESQRCELSGIDGIVSFIELLVEKFNIPEGQCTVGCDNTAALRVFDLEYHFEATISDFDYLSSLQKRIRSCNIKFIPKWIKGHQEDFVAYDQLDRWAMLNIEMDSLSKAFRSYVECNPVAHPSYKGKLHCEGWTFILNNEKWHHAHRRKLYNAIYSDQVTSYWEKKREIDPNKINTIHWSLIEDLMKGLIPPRRRWITKHWSSNCGIGTTMVKWKYQVDAECPRCEQVEDKDHVFKCREQSAQKLWEDSMTKLAEYMAKKHTFAEITTCILSRLKSWHDNSEHEVFAFLPQAVTQAIEDQDAIGWSNFLSGLWSKKWVDAQQSYFVWLGKRQTGRRWAISIIKLLVNIAWDMWSHRNGLRHAPSNKRTTKAISLLNNAIREEFTRGVTTLPRTIHHYFDTDLETLLSKPLPYRRNWLSTIDTARQLELEENIDDNNRGPLRKWLETGYL